MFRKKSPTELDLLIDVTLTRMLEAGPDMKEYTAAANQLTVLFKLREENSRKRISPDTLLLVSGNLLGIVLILSYEKVNVVTSRAIGFVMKLR